MPLVLECELRRLSREPQHRSRIAASRGSAGT